MTYYNKPAKKFPFWAKVLLLAVLGFGLGLYIGMLLQLV